MVHYQHLSSTLLVNGNTTLGGASTSISGTLELSGNVNLVSSAKFALASSTPGADFAASTTNFFIASTAGTTTLSVHAKTTGIKGILRKKRLKEFWRMTKDRIEACSACPFRYICHDCRALEYQATGEIDGLEYCPITF